MPSSVRSIGNDAAPDVRVLRPELSEALANVVALALEKRVEVRYADGDALAADLEAVAALLGPAPDAPADAPAATDAPRSGASGPPEAAEAGHNL